MEGRTSWFAFFLLFGLLSLHQVFVNWHGTRSALKRKRRGLFQRAAEPFEDPETDPPAVFQAQAQSWGKVRQRLIEALAVRDQAVALLDVASLQNELSIIDELSAAPDFWADAVAAGRLVQRRGFVEKQLGRMEKWQRLADDAKAVCELVEEVGDDSGGLLEEAAAAVASLEEDVNHACRQQILQMLMHQLEEGAHYIVDGERIMLTASGLATANELGLLTVTTCNHVWECLRDRVHNRCDGKGKYQAYRCKRCGRFQRRYL